MYALKECSSETSLQKTFIHRDLTLRQETANLSKDVNKSVKNKGK